MTIGDILRLGIMSKPLSCFEEVPSMKDPAWTFLKGEIHDT